MKFSDRVRGVGRVLNEAEARAAVAEFCLWMESEAPFEGLRRDCPDAPLARFLAELRLCRGKGVGAVRNPATDRRKRLRDNKARADR